jgi:hypothetical protein
MTRMVFTFPSAHLAMVAEDAMRDRGLHIAVIPTPPGHGSVCGLAISLEEAEAAMAQSLLEGRSIQWSELFPHERPGTVH